MLLLICVFSQTTLQEVVELDEKGLIERKLSNPLMKDDVTIPDGGYTVIRFTADNPGILIFILIENYCLIYEYGKPI